MSERGSFTTEYIYCKKCYKIVLDALTRANTTIFPNLELPIVAGKAHGMYDGEELIDMEDIIEEISEKICHPVRIAVLPDGGQNAILVAKPTKEADPE